MLTDEKTVARVVHEANRALQIAQGDPNPSPEWDQREAWQDESTFDTITKVRGGATAEDLFDLWKEFKFDSGWKYGPVKDGDAKTHPLLNLEFDELPEDQRLKDELMVAIIKALS